MSDEAWDIADDEGLRDAVRTETQYDSSEVSTEDLKGLVDSAKRDLALRAGVTSFYDDRGLTQALLGVTCAKSKGAVENSPTITENIGPNDVTFRSSDGSSLQVGQYEEMVQRGLSNSNKTNEGVQNIELTRTFLHD